MGRRVVGAALLGVMVLMTPWVAAEEKVTSQSATSATPAARETASDQAAATPAAAPAPAPLPPSPVLKYKTKEEGVRAQLDGTTWTLTLSPLDEASKAKPKTDTLTFTKNEIASAQLAKSGYAPSHYSLTIRGHNIVWDTMQAQEKEGNVLWHGELVGASMRGVVSERAPNGKGMDFTISGSETSEKAITVPSEKDLQPAASTGGQTAAAPATPASQSAHAANGSEEKRGYLW